MMSGMTKAKIAVTLPRPLVVKAKRAVRAGYADSVSAYVATALENQTKLDDLRGLLDEMLAESGGLITAKERREAQRMLGLNADGKGRRAA